jgi:hypothetical protein
MEPVIGAHETAGRKPLRPPEHQWTARALSRCLVKVIAPCYYAANRAWRLHLLQMAPRRQAKSGELDRAVNACFSKRHEVFDQMFPLDSSWRLRFRWTDEIRGSWSLQSRLTVGFPAIKRILAQTTARFDGILPKA